MLSKQREETIIGCYLKVKQNMIRGLQLKTILLILKLMLAAGCFFYFLYVVPYHIGFKEQMQMFVFSSSNVMSYFSKPAVFACLGGDFLTQFLLFKAGGAAVITLLLATEWWLIVLTLKRFSVKAQHTTYSKEMLYVVALLPVIVEWISIPKYLFSLDLSVSFIIALSTFLIYTKTHGKISVITGILLIPVLYLIAGASVFLFVILVILYDIFCGRKRYFYLAVLLGVVISLPVLVRHSCLLALKQAYFYPYPDIIQGLSLITLALLVLILVCLRNLKLKILKPVIIFIVVVSLLIAGLVKTTDKDQENLFGIIIEAYHENWDRVLTISEKAKLNNIIATIYTNIALSQKSLLGERLLDFYQPYSAGLIPRFSATYNVIDKLADNDVFFYLHDMDMAHRGALIALISSPKKRSARIAERLADINLSIGDIPAANKYIRMLESTLFHKKKLESRIAESVQRREPVIFKEDIIRSEQNTPVVLKLLVESNPDNLSAVNYLLCYHLLNSDVSSFFDVYSSYARGKINPVPKVYAEALMIYFSATGTMNKMTEYGIPPEILKSFNEYSHIYEQSRGNLNVMSEKYSNSYWLYYHAAMRKRTNK